LVAKLGHASLLPNAGHFNLRANIPKSANLPALQPNNNEQTGVHRRMAARQRQLSSAFGLIADGRSGKEAPERAPMSFAVP
jgi:hypothetical protein